MAWEGDSERANAQLADQASTFSSAMSAASLAHYSRMDQAGSTAMSHVDDQQRNSSTSHPMARSGGTSVFGTQSLPQSTSVSMPMGQHPILQHPMGHQGHSFQSQGYGSQQSSPKNGAASKPFASPKNQPFTPFAPNKQPESQVQPPHGQGDDNNSSERTRPITHGSLVVPAGVPLPGQRSGMPRARVFTRRKAGQASTGRLPGKDPLVLHYDDLVPYFGISQRQACTELGIGLSTMKRLCRRFGIKRWPGASLYSNDNNPQQLATASASTSEPQQESQQWSEAEPSSGSGDQTMQSAPAFSATPPVKVEDENAMASGGDSMALGSPFRAFSVQGPTQIDFTAVSVFAQGEMGLQADKDYPPALPVQSSEPYYSAKQQFSHPSSTGSFSTSSLPHGQSYVQQPAATAFPGQPSMLHSAPQDYPAPANNPRAMGGDTVGYSHVNGVASQEQFGGGQDYAQTKFEFSGYGGIQSQAPAGSSRVVESVQHVGMGSQSLPGSFSRVTSLAMQPMRSQSMPMPAQSMAAQSVARSAPQQFGRSESDGMRPSGGMHTTSEPVVMMKSPVKDAGGAADIKRRLGLQSSVSKTLRPVELSAAIQSLDLGHGNEEDKGEALSSPKTAAPAGDWLCTIDESWLQCNTNDETSTKEPRRVSDEWMSFPPLQVQFPGSDQGDGRRDSLSALLAGYVRRDSLSRTGSVGNSTPGSRRGSLWECGPRRDSLVDWSRRDSLVVQTGVDGWRRDSMTGRRDSLRRDSLSGGVVAQRDLYGGVVQTQPALTPAYSSTTPLL